MERVVVHRVGAVERRHHRRVRAWLFSSAKCTAISHTAFGSTCSFSSRPSTNEMGQQLANKLGHRRAQLRPRQRERRRERRLGGAARARQQREQLCKLVELRRRKLVAHPRPLRPVRRRVGGDRRLVSAKSMYRITVLRESSHSRSAAERPKLVEQPKVLFEVAPLVLRVRQHVEQTLDRAHPIAAGERRGRSRGVFFTTTGTSARGGGGPSGGGGAPRCAAAAARAAGGGVSGDGGARPGDLRGEHLLGAGHLVDDVLISRSTAGGGGRVGSVCSGGGGRRRRRRRGPSSDAPMSTSIAAIPSAAMIGERRRRRRRLVGGGAAVVFDLEDAIRVDLERAEAAGGGHRTSDAKHARTSDVGQKRRMAAASAAGRP